jgi:predicted secreted protein
MKQARKLLAALLCLCAFVAPGFAATVLTEADADAPRVIAVGETIELRLIENPSTGYTWSVTLDPSTAAAVVADRWTPAGGSGAQPMPGASGTRDLTIAIKRPGPLAIRAKNWRAWEGDASVTQRLEFRLDAR